MKIILDGITYFSLPVESILANGPGQFPSPNRVISRPAEQLVLVRADRGALRASGNDVVMEDELGDFLVVSGDFYNWLASVADDKGE